MPAFAANAPLSGRYPAAGAIFRPFAALAAILALALLAPMTASAQVGSGALQGKVTDVETGEPLPFVNVVLFLNGIPIFTAELIQSFFQRSAAVFFDTSLAHLINV